MSIKTQIKKLLVPTASNNYHPYFVRVPVLIMVLALVVTTQLLSHRQTFDPATPATVSNQFSSESLLAAINSQRSQAGASGLHANELLDQAAAAKAEDMFKQNYWQHYAPDGSKPWDFVRREGYKYAQAGEVLAKDFDTADGVVAGWLASPEHKTNILDTTYQDVGVSIQTGQLAGTTTTVVVALLAAPSTGPQIAIAPAGNETKFNLSAKPARFSVVNPLPPQATLNWAARAAIPVLALMIIIYLSQHLVWRNKRWRWDKGWHRHPLVLAAGLVGIILILIVSSFGSVL